MAMPETQLMVAQDYVAQLAISPDQAAKAYQALREITKTVLQENVDYGTIPGTPKPTLYKSGAENLLRFYGLGHTIQKTHSVEDWEKGFFHYEYKVTIHKTLGNGAVLVLSECEASCNSREKKYVKQDPFSIVNTIQKMAIKRGLVGAALQATGASGLFTQDLEDMDINDIRGQSGNSGGQGNSGNGNRGGAGNTSGPSEPQIKYMHRLKNDKGINDVDFHRMMADMCNGKTSTKDLNKKEASDFINFLNSYIPQQPGDQYQDNGQPPIEIDDKDLPF